VLLAAPTVQDYSLTEVPIVQVNPRNPQEERMMITLPNTLPPRHTDICEFSGRDGRRLELRRVAPGDTVLLVDLLLRLSPHARRSRYLAPRHVSLDDAWREAERMGQGHAGGRITVLASAPRPGGDEAIAVAELVPDHADPTTGHLGIVVRDDHQGRGIGTAAMRQLLALAREDGVATFRADLLAENHAARSLLDRLGLPYTARTCHGETMVIGRLVTPLDLPNCPA
jgi:RimJ/RimL family protein N-acetyltransferase